MLLRHRYLFTETTVYNVVVCAGPFTMDEVGSPQRKHSQPPMFVAIQDFKYLGLHITFYNL